MMKNKKYVYDWVDTPKKKALVRKLIKEFKNNKDQCPNCGSYHVIQDTKKYVCGECWSQWN